MFPYQNLVPVFQQPHRIERMGFRRNYIHKPLVAADLLLMPEIGLWSRLIDTQQNTHPPHTLLKISGMCKKQ